MRILIFLIFIITACGSPSPPPMAGTNSKVDLSTYNIDTTVEEKPSVEVEPIVQTNNEESSNTLSLEIKENITLNKSLTFYHYSSMQNSATKNDKVFYFLLDSDKLTLQQYDKNMAITLECPFTITKPWTRNLTLQYNILKTELTSDINQSIPFEIGLKENKVNYVKLGENKFYAAAPIVSKVIVPNTTNSEYHIVKSGENLKLIAERYTVSIRQLLNLNIKINDRQDYVVYPGEKIRIK